jgi:hypothetical protein
MYNTWDVPWCIFFIVHLVSMGYSVVHFKSFLWYPWDLRCYNLTIPIIYIIFYFTILDMNIMGYIHHNLFSRFSFLFCFMCFYSFLYFFITFVLLILISYFLYFFIFLHIFNFIYCMRYSYSTCEMFHGLILVCFT